MEITLQALTFDSPECFGKPCLAVRGLDSSATTQRRNYWIPSILLAILIFRHFVSFLFFFNFNHFTNLYEMQLVFEDDLEKLLNDKQNKTKTLEQANKQEANHIDQTAEVISQQLPMFGWPPPLLFPKFQVTYRNFNHL